MALGIPDLSAQPNSKSAFAAAVLQGVGAPISDQNVQFMLAWMAREGTSAAFNPLATTLDYGSNTKFNSVGVRNYSDFDTGVAATVQTILYSGYGDIVQGLKSGNGAWEASAGLSRWSGGGYSSLSGVQGQDGDMGGGNGGGGGATGTPQPNGTTNSPTGAQAPTKQFHAAQGGTVTTIAGGYQMILYQVAPGLFVAFADDGTVDVTGLGTQDLSEDQWNGLKGQVVLSGNSKELEPASEYSNFQEFWTHIIDLYLGPGEARNDPGILRVMAEVAARPDMSPDEIQNKIKQTTYWQNKTEGQLAWNDKSPAEQQKEIADQMAILTNQYVSLVGYQPSENSLKAMNWWATQVASGAKGINEAINTFVKGDALNTPESPWNRQLRNEQEQERQRGVDVSNEVETVRQNAAKWGVQLSEDTIKQWGNDIVTKNKADADLTAYLRGQAQVLYPWMKTLDPAGETPTEQLATPWLQTYARVMEKPADLLNPAIQKALTNGTPAWQFEQDLKSKPEWQQTKNAQDTFNTMAGDIGQRLGFG